MAEPGGHALAELEALLADDDGRLADELLGPIGRPGPWAADGARDQARVGGEVLVGLDIDENRALGRANQAGELVDGNGVD
jgi:hypothetical protein